MTKFHTNVPEEKDDKVITILDPKVNFTVCSVVKHPKLNAYWFLF